MKRLLTCSATLLLAAGSIVGLTGSATSASVAAARTTPTQFALGAAGFGTAVRGGDIPANSDTTAYERIGCTNLAGLHRVNHVAAETIPGLGRATEARTDVWTETRNGVVSAYSTHSIARIVLAQSGLGSLSLNGIQSVSRAYHDKSGFHASGSNTVGSLVFRPVTGDPQQLRLPTPGRPVTVPGLAIIEVGSTVKHVGATGARVQSAALRVRVIPSGTRTVVASTGSNITGGVRHGIFGGQSWATKLQAVQGNITSGRNPLSVMPCQGTGGKVLSKALAGSRPSDALSIGAATSSEYGVQTATRSTGWERGSVADVNVGGGQLVIKGIVARANVTRIGSKLVRNANGTKIGSVVLNGEERAIPPTGVLEIPGLAKIETNLTTNITNGISVTALRLTLLGGGGGVIDLGHADL